MSVVPGTGSVRFDISLQPHELVAAWRPDSGHLLLEVPGPVRLQQRVVSRITVLGLDVSGTISGRVVGSSPLVRAHRVELVLDELRRPTFQHLLSVAKGEPIAHRSRSPRFLVELPAVVQGAAGTHYRKTVSISAKGCGLAWSGAVPSVGETLDVRLGAGSRAASFRGEVCWTAQAGRAATVGVRFLGGHHGVWASVLHDIEGSGAPPA